MNKFVSLWRICWWWGRGICSCLLRKPVATQHRANCWQLTLAGTFLTRPPCCPPAARPHRWTAAPRSRTAHCGQITTQSTPTFPLESVLFPHCLWTLWANVDVLARTELVLQLSQPSSGHLAFLPRHLDWKYVETYLISFNVGMIGRGLMLSTNLLALGCHHDPTS